MASNWLVAQPPTRSSDRKWMSSGRDFDRELTMLVMPLPGLPLWRRHMTVMVTRISGQSSVCSTVCVDWQQRNIKGLCYCPFVLGIHPHVAYRHQWTGSALVKVMACGLFSAKPLPDPMLAYCQLDLRGQISVKFEFEFYHFHSRKYLWSCRQMAAILFRGRGVNLAVRCLITWSSEISKLQDWLYKFPYHSVICQVSQQHCGRDACKIPACKISEWLETSRPISLC